MDGSVFFHDIVYDSTDTNIIHVHISPIHPDFILFSNIVFGADPEVQVWGRGLNKPKYLPGKDISESRNSLQQNPNYRGRTPDTPVLGPSPAFSNCKTICFHFSFDNFVHVLNLSAIYSILYSHFT